MDNWYADIENRVFTYVKHYIQNTYPDLDCTTKGYNIAPTQFPAMYLHELPSVEIGQDLDNISVNGVMSTIEIQMFSDISENECKEMMFEAIGLMKSLRYAVTAFPDVTTNNNIAFGVARFRRAIGNGDKLY